MENNAPGLEETNKDIEITRRELEAYRKIKEGFEELCKIPDQTPENQSTFYIKAIHYANTEFDCQRFLDKLIRYKEKLEGKNGSE